MNEALGLWGYICRKAWYNHALIFIQDEGMPVGSYSVDGFTIRHNSTAANPAAVMAVAAIAEKLFGAKMPEPDLNSITLDVYEPKDIQLKFEYKPTLLRNNWHNSRPNPAQRTWLHWHHIPTLGSQDGTFWHQSWWLGMVLKNPVLGQAGVTAIEDTKPDITHPDFARIVWEDWDNRKRPSFCSAFQIDGTKDWWANKHIPAPGYLNLGEANRFDTAIASNIRREVLPGESYRLDGIRYPLTDALNLAQANLPLNNITGERLRFNFTGFYLKAYKAIQAYFDSKGDSHVTFNVLAYSAYRCMIPTEVDLSRFHVYYVSVGANQFDEKSMLEDAAEAVKWKETGAKLIWRPNNLFGGKKDIAPLIIRWMEIVEPDGLQVPPFGDIKLMYEVMKSLPACLR